MGKNIRLTIRKDIGMNNRMNTSVEFVIGISMEFVMEIIMGRGAQIQKWPCDMGFSTKSGPDMKKYGYKGFFLPKNKSKIPELWS